MLYLPEELRYDYLLTLPESEDIGQKVNEAMEDIERENPELADVLPKEYKRFDDPVLKDLLKNFSNVGIAVEQPAIHLFEDLGWETINAYEEVLVTGKRRRVHLDEKLVMK